jgi:hypothetical protein
MAGLPVKVGDSWRSDHEERKYKEWFKALSETGGDGSHKRSNSAPAEERGHHPHIHHILSQPLNNLKSQPLEISEEENTQAALLDCPVRCPHEQFRLSFKTPTKKDVDGCQPTMRETSSTGRKRKKHQHSSDLTSLIEPEDIPSPQSLEEIAALPSVRISGASFLRLYISAALAPLTSHLEYRK